MKITREKIIKANRRGLKNPHEMLAWHTPTLQVAYDLGQRGVDLSAQPTVSGVRYGAMPESGLSYNYRDDRSERGLSLAQLDGEAEVGSVVWFASRKLVRATGLLLPYRGSDGEPLILPYGVDDLDGGAHE